MTERRMIQPEDIHEKAEKLYELYLRAWLTGDDSFFPRIVPAHRQPPSNMASAIQMIQRLRDGSKEKLGYGYSVRWREVNSRKHGRNSFPDQIAFESANDLLRFVRKEKEFASFVAAVTRIRDSFPSLGPWIAANVRQVIRTAPDLGGLLEVVGYLRDHPRPNRFVRELPLTVDTKFIERHQSLLRQWLDLILPAHSIRADEDHFERRYGLRYAEPHILVRFLDSHVQQELGFPCEEVSAPLYTVANWTVERTRVVIVENKVNLLTLPCLQRAIGLGGLGRAVTLLRYVGFLAGAPITYWGDVDIEGFEILSSLRALFPQTQSILMSHAILDTWERLTVAGSGRQPGIPPHLTVAEKTACAACLENNLRLEQERLPQSAVVEALDELGPWRM